MGDSPIYKRPLFYIAGWLAFWLAVYFLQIYRMGGVPINEVRIFLDFICIVPLLVFWMAFFSQFILPVGTLTDRLMIFGRLITYLLGGHGPAIFFRDGEPVQSEGEERKKGPGVLWLDSASGVVTRTDTAFKNTFGPGVHFTESGERIAGNVDLHTQVHGIGPRENENPFEKKSDQLSEEEKAAIQGRRTETSALTRDGIEVIPNINVIFKIDADPVTDPNLPGSRFGFDAESVRLAITGEAINPNLPRDSHRYHVPWNQLPALLAADIWRDLVSQFTLNDLFTQRYTLPPAIPNPPRQTISEGPLYNPIKPQSRFEDFLTGIVKESTLIISRLADWIDKRCKPKEEIKPEKPFPEGRQDLPKEKKWTGLQLINYMLRERLQKQNTAVLDRYGNYQPGSASSSSEHKLLQTSSEHKLLQSRGIRVITAAVSNLRMPSEVNDKLIEQWTANWLGRAREEQDRLNQEEGYNRIESEENALRDYIVLLSDDLLAQAGNNRATDLRETLRSLMLQSRVALVRETQLFRQGSPEREGLEEIIQWLEGRDL